MGTLFLVTLILAVGWGAVIGLLFGAPLVGAAIGALIWAVMAVLAGGGKVWWWV